MEKTIKVQFGVLLLGTIFAWSNFGVELVGWLKNRSCTLGCAASANPFLSPCFFGALFFLTAFVLNVMISRARKEEAGLLPE